MYIYGETGNTSIGNDSDSGTMFEAIPWSFYPDDKVRFWVHYGMVILGFVLALITTVAQWTNPAPYGKHSKQDANWGCEIPQRLGHIISDAVPGVVLFILVFFLYGNQRQPVNIVFLVLFQAHYIHRGIIHPIIMRYSSPTVPLGITLGGFFPNAMFHFLCADFIGNAKYADNYHYDPRFIIGLVLFIIGYIINKWADWKLRELRKQRSKNSYAGYYIPYGGMFELVTCPNYFGEFVEWFGWALATWSLAGLVWFLFGVATFFPRSWHNHKWYQQQFENYPSNRRAMIPFIY